MDNMENSGGIGGQISLGSTGNAGSTGNQGDKKTYWDYIKVGLSCATGASLVLSVLLTVILFSFNWGCSRSYNIPVMLWPLAMTRLLKMLCFLFIIVAALVIFTSKKRWTKVLKFIIFLVFPVILFVLFCFGIIRIRSAESMVLGLAAVAAVIPSDSITDYIREDLKNGLGCSAAVNKERVIKTITITSVVVLFVIVFAFLGGKFAFPRKTYYQTYHEDKAMYVVVFETDDSVVSQEAEFKDNVLNININGYVYHSKVGKKFTYSHYNQVKLNNEPTSTPEPTSTLEPTSTPITYQFSNY